MLQTGIISCGFIFLTAVPSVLSQTATVRLVDGKSGRPLKNSNVTVIFDSEPSRQIVIRIGEEGRGSVSSPKSSDSFLLMAGPKDGKEPYRVPYEVCNVSSSVSIKIFEVVSQGVSLKNGCGKHELLARPGEVIFWAHPLPWWQPDMQ